jgi:hypothetical protein
MFGKGALIYVAGFSLVFAIYTIRLSDLTTRVSDNFNKYFVENLVHEAAQSAMNFAVNKVWDTETSSDSFYIYDSACTTYASISEPNLDTVLVRVNTRSRVFDPEYYVTQGEMMPVEDSIFAYFSYDIPASRYFWFTNNENGVYWIAGDTVWGPIHSNGVLKTNGDPVFYGKATAKTGINPSPTAPGSNAHFYGGYEIGVDVDLPTDMSPMITAALNANGGTPGSGGADWNTKSMYNQEVWFEFLNNGDVIRTIPSLGVLDTVTLTDITSTGVIQCNQDVHVKGVLDGQISIHTDQTIYIEDDIVYANNPLVDPSSDDILGLVADGDVLIADNPANWTDVSIQATIIAPNGGFGADNYSSRPVSGAIYLTGSVVQDSRGPVGTFTHSITHGFSKRYYYDPRLQSMAAPYYPTLRELHLVSWWE